MKGEGIIVAADTVTKAYIRKNEVFADAFNYFMYDGIQKIQPKQLRELDSTEMAILLNEKDTKDKTNKEKEASEQKMVQVPGSFENGDYYGRWGSGLCTVGDREPDRGSLCDACQKYAV